MNVVNNTVMKNQQTAQCKTINFNGTVKSRQLATVISANPNLGDVYIQQFKAIQEVVRAKELNAWVLKEVTDRAHDQIELPVNT